VELSITGGSFCFFLFWFFGFAKLLPTIPANELKEQVGEEQVGEVETPADLPPRQKLGKVKSCVLAVFDHPRALVEALAKVRRSAFTRLEYYSPIRLEAADAIMAPKFSPVRLWTLAGALAGLTGGFSLAIGSALVNSLIVGGKHPVSPIPYCVIAFEGTILLGTLANLTGMLVHARLGRKKLPPHYDGRFTQDKFGMLIACEADELPQATALAQSTNPREVHVHER
jgi:molybdopterin-containing oxidoreductase family membrane subunit